MSSHQAAPGKGDGGLATSLRRLFSHMSPHRRRHLRLVLVLMLLSAIGELVALGAILPFLSLLADPERAMNVPFVVEFFGLFGAREPRELIVVAAILFGLAALGAGLVRLVFTWSSYAFVFRFGREIAVEMQRHLLHQPYTYHVMTNSSRPISALEKIQALIFNVLAPLIQAVAAVLISVFIITALLLIDPVVAISSAVVFAFLYLLVSLLTRKRLKRNAAIVNQSYASRVQAVQESIGAIRDILLDRAQLEYIQQYAAIEGRLRRAQIVTTFIAAAPRFVIEAFGMVLIAVIALLLASREGGIGGAVPVLGALALGAQRLLPLVQSVYYGWASVRGHHDAVDDVLEMIELPYQDDQGPVSPLVLTDAITLEGVDFKYPARDEPVLQGIDLTIPCGSRIALVGQTGSGKSTMADLIMGLVQPTAGRILINGEALTGDNLRAWQANIAHVPQAIFLSDTSILSNIAFGVPADRIDRARAERAAEQAQMHDFISALPDGYETSVGERGVRLSGGQRQRLGIARALYKDASILVLDEATSALDDATESAVMASLDGLDRKLTIVMIAHRLSTIAKCDQVVRLAEGRVIDRGTYAAIVKSLQLEQV